MSAAVAGTACRDATTTAPCILVLYVTPTLPETVTVKVGASTIAIAGATQGACEARPRADFVWRVSDSNVVRVTPLDSINARIQGLRAGFATVTPFYRTDSTRTAPPGVSVTVIP